MSKYLHDIVLRDLVAPSIADDATVKAVAEALDPILQSLYRQTPQLLIWSRLLQTAGLGIEPHNAPLARVTEAAGGLKNLPTEMLEQLAWQLHVDFREAAKDDRQLAGLVANSIPWHRIKGTPASLTAALELFGFRDVVIEEDGKGKNWATYQLGLSAAMELDAIRHIVAIAHEMQPARCRLWRIWTHEYDWRDGQWNWEDWGDAWWSGVSGFEIDIPGRDDEHGLIVSLGARRGFASELCYPDGVAGIGTTTFLGCLAPYIDRPIWNWALWGDVFPKNHAFVIGNLHSFVFSHAPGKPADWLPSWTMRRREVARSQAAWSLVPVYEDEPGHTYWNDINANYGRPKAVTFEQPVWGEPWGAPTGRREWEVLVQQRNVDGMGTVPVDPQAPQADCVYVLASATAPLHDTHWRGKWNKRRWWGYVAHTKITTETAKE